MVFRLRKSVISELSRAERLGAGMFALLCFCASTILLCCASTAQGADTVIVKPKEIDDLLANPGMGWQTFHHFADDDPNLEGLPSSCAYFRFYWKEIEPEEGKIDFEKFDRLLAHARKCGQKLAFRIMCAGTTKDDYSYVPEWLREKGCRGFEYRYYGEGVKHWVPDMDDPIFLKAHLRLIDELGKRYDGHPDLDLVDIGSVGLWGEWHMSGTGVSLPSLKTRLAIVDEYCKAFPRTPKVMLIGGKEALKHAIQKGCGWRADCLGDMGGFSKTWCHMKNFYPQAVKAAGAEDAWRVAPVAFESCWDMRKWVKEGWDVHFIFDYALRFHASYLNNKSVPIPKGTRKEIEWFLRRLGYRLVLRSLKYDRSVKAGGSLPVATEWENVGVAPPYHDYFVAFRLRSLQSKNETVMTTKTSIKGWLPGKKDLRQLVNLSKEIAPGEYELAVGVVEAATTRPAVRLAIEGRDEIGWYPMGKVRIEQ